MNSNIENIVSKLRQSQKELKDRQKKSCDLCDVHLDEEYACLYAQLKNRKQQTIVQNIINAEATSSMFKKIRWAITPPTNSQIDEIVIPNGDNFQLVTDAGKIYEHILCENKAVMTSSNQSLPAMPQFREYIGEYGEKYGMEEIMSGITLPSDITRNQYEKSYLEAITSLETADVPFPLIAATISFEEFRQIFLATRESTASSPSGLHMGHYQVGALYPHIGELLAHMISLPFKYSFAPKWWKKSIHLMMEMKKGFPLVSKLRMIQLFEADFNAVLKLKIGRQLMHQPVVEKNFRHEMHGGRQHRSTHPTTLV